MIELHPRYVVDATQRAFYSSNISTYGGFGMSEIRESYSVDDHFVGKDPSVRKLYDRLISLLRKLGPIQEEARKTSIHLVNVSALAGVEVRKDYMLLNIKSDHKIRNPRTEKTEQISAKRFHHKVKVSSLGDLDNDLQAWLRGAYELSR